MEDAYIIQGGKTLKGTVQLSGAKNVALKTIIASLLFEGDVILNNIPRINDVIELVHLITNLGGKASFTGKNTIVLNSSSLNSNKVDLLHGSKIRTSFMMFAPLLYKFKEAFIPNPGGCRLGARPIDRVVDGMKALGVDVGYNSETGYYQAKKNKSIGGTYTFAKSSHTGTELLIMIGLLSEDHIVINGAAMEPEIDDLIDFLVEGGAKITREKDVITVYGSQHLKQTKPYTIMPDRIEAMTYAVLGILTKGDITISSIAIDTIQSFIDYLKEAGGGVEQIENNGWRFFYKGNLKSVDITTSPYPGFLTDWQPLAAILMTQAEGESIIHEKIFENRFSYVSELRKLGAIIDFQEVKVENPSDFYHFNYDPSHTYHQAIKVTGPQKFHNGVVTISDIRAGVTLAIAALMAPGESIVNGASVTERGYEDFVEKVMQLGGNIKKI